MDPQYKIQDHLKRNKDYCFDPFLITYINQCYHPRHLVDMGCSLGWYVDQARNLNINAIGVDNTSELKCHHQDLREDFNIGHFDVAICIEVAEHIEDKYADQLLKNLATSSNRIIFSANSRKASDFHVNLQPNKYWIEKFNKLQYRFNKQKTEVMRFECTLENLKYDLMVFEKEPKFPDKFCIVGPSGSLLEKMEGNKIDSYPRVFRLNLFNLNPEYKDICGTKITDWVIRPGKHWFSTIIPQLKKMEIYEQFLKWINKCEAWCPFPIYNLKFRKRYDFNDKIHHTLIDRLNVIPDDIFNRLHNKIKDPTLGLSLLYWLHESGRLNKEDIFGIDAYGSHRHYYYRENLNGPTPHNMEAEKKLLTELLG